MRKTTKSIQPFSSLPTISNLLDSKTLNNLQQKLEHQLINYIQDYLQFEFSQLVNDEDFLLLQVRNFLHKRFGHSFLTVESNHKTCIGLTSTPVANHLPIPLNNEWSIAPCARDNNLDSPFDFINSSIFDTATTLKSFLHILSSSETIINSADIPQLFTEICEHLFNYILQLPQDEALNVPTYYLSALQSLDLDQILLALFPQPKYYTHILSMSTIPHDLKTLYYRKYLAWSKQSLESLQIHTLWLTKNQFVALGSERAWLLIAVATLADGITSKLTLLNIQQSASPKNYAYLLQHLKDHNLRAPQLIIHDNDISGDEIRAIFPHTPTWLVMDAYKPLRNLPKVSLPSETRSDYLQQTTHVLTANAATGKKKIPTKNVESNLQNKNIEHNYIKIFHKLIQPLQRLGVAGQTSLSKSPLAIGILWQMLKISVEGLSVLPISE